MFLRNLGTDFSEVFNQQQIVKSNSLSVSIEYFFNLVIHLYCYKMKKHLLFLAIFCSLASIAVKGNPRSLFPGIKGWKTDINDIVYDNVTLWEYIDGAADIYLAYDFENLFIAVYTNNKGKAINVELYRHSSADNAFGIYSAERMPDYNFVDVGVQGYYEPGVLNFFTGQYYVKMSSSGNSLADKAAFLEIAAAINNTLDTGNKWPPVLGLFPPEGKIANSESYIARDFLGYSILHSAFTAEYDMKEKFKMFIIKLNSESEVKSMLESYSALLNEDKITEESNIRIIHDFFNGMLFILVNSNYMIGVINTTDKDLAIDYINKVRVKM